MRDEWHQRLTEHRYGALDVVPGATFDEKVAHLVVMGPPAAAFDAAPLRELVRDVERFDTSGLRAVVFGGGGGLSTIVGGDSRDPSWPEDPFTGLKNAIGRVAAVVCTTDDGGSTGELVRRLPLVALGDLRRVALSLVRRENVQRLWGVRGDGVRAACTFLHRVMNYRFRPDDDAMRILRDPERLREPDAPAAPAALAAYLRELGGWLSASGRFEARDLAGHCLGNLLLAAAVLRRAGDDGAATPAAIRAGIEELGSRIGVDAGSLRPAVAVQGELRLLYAHGVRTIGEDKSSKSRRGVAVERVEVLYRERPEPDESLLRQIAEADLIVLAPGSLYTSLVPVLHAPGVAAAIRTNRAALKVLAANFWVQAGETDISSRAGGHGYHVSDLIDAFERNVPGGASGLFRWVVSADLRSIPADVIRNYALEGKVPIHLNRGEVVARGFTPFEAPVVSDEKLALRKVIQHGPARFAKMLRSLLYLHRNDPPPPAPRRPDEEFRPIVVPSPWLCERVAAFNARLAAMRLEPPSLARALADLAWAHRDLRSRHFDRVEGVITVPDGAWDRSRDWDDVLAYYEPDDSLIRIHEDLLLDRPDWLHADLLVALGQAFLGRYAVPGSRRIVPLEKEGPGHRFEFRLLPEAERRSGLDDRQLRTFLGLARLSADPDDLDRFSLLVNADEGFVPPGLLFGFSFAWYLDNRAIGAMEHEMAVLRLPAADLLPHQKRDASRRRKLVELFRTVVFGLWHPV